jgi:hypothetical protein
MDKFKEGGKREGEKKMGGDCYKRKKRLEQARPAAIGAKYQGDKMRGRYGSELV